MTTVTIDGLEELIKATARIGHQAMPLIQVRSDEAGKVILEVAKQNVAEKTGFLKKSLRQSKRRLKAQKLSTFNYIGFSRKAAYGIPLELGHRLVIKGTPAGVVTPRPFLRPAADASKGMVEANIVKGMNEALAQMGGKKI